jgi:ABC-type nickel/cobalt efflux system permease component RcnA
LVLIFAFSVGLAAVLTGIGFVLVYARRLSERLSVLGAIQQGVGRGGALSSLAIRAFPAASASAVVVAGLVVTLRALVLQGVL